MLVYNYGYECSLTAADMQGFKLSKAKVPLRQNIFKCNFLSTIF
jgi:hypothetical protein